MKGEFMAFRVFITLLALANIYFIYEVAQLARARGALESVPPGFSIGPENADLSVVEFLDYSCPHCRNIHPVIMEAIKRDGRIKYIPRPVPSKTPGSLKYAKAAYAAGQQGKLIEMHDELMRNFRAMDEDDLIKLAADMGIDAEKFKADMAPDKAEPYLKKNSWLFAYMRTPSFPYFVIGKNLAFSPTTKMPSPDDFLKLFHEARGEK